MKIDWTHKDSTTVDKLETTLEELKENKSHIMLVDWQQEILLDYITNLQRILDKVTKYNQSVVNDYLESDCCEYCDGRYATATHNLSILQGSEDNE